MNETKKVSGSKLIVACFKDKATFPEGLDTKSQVIVDHLAKMGTVVNVGLVNNIKSRIRNHKEQKKAERKSRVKVPANTIQSDFDKMVAVKQFADSVGGLDVLSTIIDKVRLIAA